MEKNQKIENIILKILILVIVFSYFIGFYFNENSAGGGEGDFTTWTFRNLVFFDSFNLQEALGVVNIDSSSKVFQSSRLPGFYVFNKFFNPFTNDPYQFRLSILILSLLVPIIFYFSLILKFKDTNKIYLLFLASLILLSPYFRTSAIWGNEENLAYITLVGSYYFLLKYLKFQKQKLLSLTFLIITSSLCVYFDQKFTLVPAICFFIIFFSEKDLKLKAFTILLYTLLALPVFYLFFTWGGLMPPVDQVGRNVRLGDHYLQNIGYALTMISFYLVPFIIAFLLEKKKVNYLFSLNKNEIFVYLLSSIYLIYFLFYYDISSDVLVGKGVIYKFSILVADNLFFQKIIISVGILISIKFILLIFEKNFSNIFLILFLILTPIFYRPVLQEYYDPLIFILLFTFFKPKFLISFKNLMILFSFFTFFLTFANIYYSDIIQTIE